MTREDRASSWQAMLSSARQRMLDRLSEDERKARQALSAEDNRDPEKRRQLVIGRPRPKLWES